MRLPTLGGESANVDEPQVTRMLHYAIDHGVNYVDTAYPYHDGNSERVLGRALQGGYRGKIRLATKLPCWDVKEAGDLDRFLDEQLERLQTGHIDFYLLHALNGDRWQKMRDLGVPGRAEQALADGRIGYLGFSFHGGYEAFQEIIDGYNNRMPKEARASVCTQCRECEEKCPQSIPISEWMAVVHQVLGEGKPYVCALP